MAGVLADGRCGSLWLGVLLAFSPVGQHIVCVDSEAGERTNLVPRVVGDEFCAKGGRQWRPPFHQMREIFTANSLQARFCLSSDKLRVPFLTPRLESWFACKSLPTFEVRFDSTLRKTSCRLSLICMSHLVLHPVHFFVSLVPGAKVIPTCLVFMFQSRECLLTCSQPPRTISFSFSVDSPLRTLSKDRERWLKRWKKEHLQKRHAGCAVHIRQFWSEEPGLESHSWAPSLPFQCHCSAVSDMACTGVPHSQESPPRPPQDHHRGLCEALLQSPSKRYV